MRKLYWKLGLLTLLTGTIFLFLCAYPIKTNTKALKVLNHYRPSQVGVILVGVHSGTASGRYYLLDRVEDAELFAGFLEMFWADDAVYKEKNPFIHSNPSWQITFVDKMGEMLTLDVFSEGEEVGYEGKHFVQSKIDNSVVNQLIQEKNVTIEDLIPRGVLMRTLHQNPKQSDDCFDRIR